MARMVLRPPPLSKRRMLGDTERASQHCKRAVCGASRNPARRFAAATPLLLKAKRVLCDGKILAQMQDPSTKVSTQAVTER